MTHAIIHSSTRLYTKKRALCALDDKRYLLEDGITSLAFGHRDIPARAQDIEDEAQPDTILNSDEAPNAGSQLGRCGEDRRVTTLARQTASGRIVDVSAWRTLRSCSELILVLMRMMSQRSLLSQKTSLTMSQK